MTPPSSPPDLLVPLVPLGIAFDFHKGEGPVIEKPVASAADVATLRRFEPRQELAMVLEAIRLLRRELKVPLIGFVGAPFTLASYAIEGGHSSHFAKTKGLMYGDPATWHRLAALLRSEVAQPSHHATGKAREFQTGARAKTRRHQGRHSVFRGVMQPRIQRFPWRLFLCELSGTAVLVLVGLSLVIVMFGTGSPMPHLLPSEGPRQGITGFLFGTTDASIALSVVGKKSGAHINPVVTMAFWLFRKLDSRTALIYVLAQLAGGSIGSLPLLAWGRMGRSVAFGATLPGAGCTSRD